MIQAVTCANTKTNVMYRKCKILVSVLLSQIFISKYWYWYQFLNKWYSASLTKVLHGTISIPYLLCFHDYLLVLKEFAYNSVDNSVAKCTNSYHHRVWLCCSLTISYRIELQLHQAVTGAVKL